jgi:prepilin-type N-terminal cleavage/methylation domain-containing protein
MKLALPVPRRGFTLIELMIVIAIMAVVMSLSIPTFYRSLERDTIRRATQKILDFCADARAQAIISGRPCDLVIHPAERSFAAQLVADPAKSAEQLAVEQAERDLLEALQPANEEVEPGEETERSLPKDIAILFIGVNFVPDLQVMDAVHVRFYPNGTGDEFTMVIGSDQNAVRKFTMEVATGVVKWEVLREGVQ